MADHFRIYEGASCLFWANAASRRLKKVQRHNSPDSTRCESRECEVGSVRPHRIWPAKRRCNPCRLRPKRREEPRLCPLPWLYGRAALWGNPPPNRVSIYNNWACVCGTSSAVSHLKVSPDVPIR